MDMNQYLDVFIEESKEHLQTCNEQLLELERSPENITIVNEIFRSAHTLKGMSATMGYEDLANLTHNMENVLDGIRNQKISVSSNLLDVVFQAVDDLEEMVFSIADGGDGKKDVSEIVQRLEAIEKGESYESLQALNETAATTILEGSSKLRNTYDQFNQTVIEQSRELGFSCYEIAISLREDCLLKAARVFMVFEVLEKCGEVIKSTPTVDQLEEEQFDQEFVVTLVTKEEKMDIEKKIVKVSEVEKVIISQITIEMIREMDNETGNSTSPGTVRNENILEGSKGAQSVKTEPNSQTNEISKPQSKLSNHTNKTIRVNIERLDILMNLFEELVIDRGRLEQISKELKHSELNDTVERMSRISGDLQNIILNMRMVPIETVFNRFPKMVRQLAKDLNKKIELKIIGAETELDRTVIDEIGDPLVHLIRNALDHGIETIETRIKAGKPETGTVQLKAFHSGNHVFIEIEDDGGGISRDRVIRKAVSRGIITEETASTLSNRQVNELIMASGFSTAETISDISGRGVGLDVVKSTIESLGGSITIDSEEGKGSIFSIQLPLTLSIIAVMLVEVQKEKYAIPLSSIIETAIVRKTEIMNAHNQKVIDYRGKVVPLVRLEDVFQVPVEKQENAEFFSVVIVRKGEKMAALVVESFMGQQEVVLKSLGNYLKDVFAISGATILGDGQVALIIDCNALIK
ncbi:two-component system chemotaxis sensor kinase CheA [Bacillus pakistanensis]|uniref:Chemotaxis protein CheA n=1 Tax=Rossellomorea pakistanensis TaxID=992288 RepID=A0ABS2NG96_9BACI|nr:chemotaxis protein CheA [Bacillus pakistanensis]MBM7586853.1 two-component system chemotaxis sensor kinase CheA [Bacillus pakistanensis]